MDFRAQFLQPLLVADAEMLLLVNDDQAEVLYPAELSTSYLRDVYTATDEHADIVASQYEMLVAQGDTSDPRTELPVHVRPDLF